MTVARASSINFGYNVIILLFICAKVLDYFATFFLIIYPIRIITALVMTLP